MNDTPKSPSPQSAIPLATTKSGIDLIREERERQITKEGWTQEHDDTHTGGELALVAAAYAIHTSSRPSAALLLWPWNRKNGGGYYEPDGFKPSICSPIRDLVKAGALIAAEIDRRQRASASVHTQRQGEGRLFERLEQKQ